MFPAHRDAAMAAAVLIGLHVTLMLKDDLARWTVSTGPVLNRRSTSAGKYWIGPIQFLLDRAFSNDAVLLDFCNRWSPV